MLSKYKLKQQVVALITAAAVFLCMMPLSGIPAQAALPDTVTPTETHPEGITIDLFDYWLDNETALDNRLAKDYKNPSFDKQGINQGYALHFGQEMRYALPGGGEEAAINIWTRSAAPRTGMVQNQLENGYPTLSDAWGGESLAYLFNENDTTTSEGDEQVEGKRAYMNVGGLLQQNEAGYYYYNSQENFASLNKVNNTFTLYKSAGVQNKDGSSQGQFFPLIQLKKFLIMKEHLQ